MPEPFVHFEVSGSRDGLVNAILYAHVRHETVRQLRRSWVLVLAVLGGVMALTIGFPRLSPASLGTNLALAWLLCGIATIATAAREWLWYRRRERLLGETRRTGEEPRS